MHEVRNRDEDGAESAARWLRPELVAPWWEIALVLAVVLGRFIYASACAGLKASPVDMVSRILNQSSALTQIAFEAGILAGLLFYLHWRGWTPADLKIRIDLGGTLLAPFLGAATMFVTLVVGVGLSVLVLELAPHPHGLPAAFLTTAPHFVRGHVDISWAVIVLLCVVNAYLEEVIFMSYAFNQFAAKRGPLFAMMVMVFLRMLLHTYKGPVGMVAISGMAFAFGLAYLYLRRIWPLILGHTLVDLLAFSLFKIFFGR